MVRNISFTPLYIVLFCIFASLYACKSDPISQSNEAVYVQINQDPERLNPVIFPYSHARAINQCIFLPLAEYDPISLEYTPILLTEIPKAQPYKAGLKYTLHILPEATWSDGMPITSEDVAFTIKAVLHPLTSASGMRSYLSNISDVSVSTTDSKQLTITFEDTYLLSLEAATNFEILPAHIYDPNHSLASITIPQLKDTAFVQSMESDSSFVRFANEINSNKFSRDIVIGSGPYKLDQWITNEAVVLSRVENYWATNRDNLIFHKANPAKIIYKIIPDQVGAMAQLKSGLIDVFPEVDDELYDQLKADSTAHQFDFHQDPIMRYYHLMVNHTDPILSDRNVRKAVAHLCNVNKYIELFENGYGQRTVSFINPAKRFYHKDLTPIPYDIELAKTILKSASWVDTDHDGILDKNIDGIKTPLKIDLYASGALGTNIGLLLKEEAAKAGMSINIIQQDFSITRKNNIATGNYGLVPSALTQDLGTDDPRLRFHSSNAVMGGSNYSFYQSPVMDSLIELANLEEDPAKLKEVYYKIQELAHEDLPFIFLYVPQNRLINHRKWKVVTSIKRPGFFPNAFAYQSNYATNKK